MNSLARLLPYLTQNWLPFWGGMGGLLVARIFEAGIPLFLMRGIDSIAEGRPRLVLPALGIAGCVISRFVCIVLSRVHVRWLGVDVAYDLRRRVYAHLQRQGPEFFARYSTGDLMARAINDIQIVRELIARGLRTVLVLVFSAIVGFSFMAYQSRPLTALLLIPLPLIGISAFVFSRRVYARSMAVQEGFSTLSERVQENMNGIRTIQAQVQEDREIERFDRVNTSYADRYFSLVRTQSFLQSWMPALGGFATIIILGFGGERVLAGEMSVGAFASFFWYVGMILWPVREMGNMVNMFQRGAAATSRLFEVLEHAPEIQDAPTVPSPVAMRGAIKIRDLSYAYPGQRGAALRNVSLDVAPGELVAVTGRVGSGKSTLLRLIARMLDPEPDQVRLDGVCVRSFPLEAARRNVAMVPQDPFLFATSLAENLSYDDPERREKDVLAAADAAQLRETIQQLPEGIDSIVGERGVTLSGGQKQRATLARGLVRDAPVLLLDDCFSSVDTETEEHILGALRELRRQSSTLMVSHRISTVRHADKIVVLDAGRVVEVGTHRELLAAAGLYAALDQSQGRRAALEHKLVGTTDHEPETLPS
jgi:ATP-binding cassette subfamily B protein